MKLELNKKDFIKALQIGGMFAGNCRTIPILECVKIKIAGDKINIVSTDNENAISKRITGVKSDEDGTFCVNMKDFSSYIKLIKADTFFITVENNIAEIKHENGSFSLPVYSDDDFPIMKPDEDSIEFVMESILLNNWIADGKSFVANDELRPAMNGLYIYSKNGEIGCCATDGHSLFTDNIKSEGMPEFSFILNKNAFRPIYDAISDVEKVRIKVGKRNVMFVADGTSVIASQIEGRYPAFKSIIRSDNNIIAYVDKKQMIDSILRCSVAENKSSNLIKLSFSMNKLHIESEDIDYNKKTDEEIDCEIEGEIKCIGFKSYLMINVLNSVSTNRAIIKMKDPSKSAIIEEENDSNKTLLIMPCLVY